MNSSENKDNISACRIRNVLLIPLVQQNVMKPILAIKLDYFSNVYVYFLLQSLVRHSKLNQTIWRHEKEFDVFMERFEIFLKRQAQS